VLDCHLHSDLSRDSKVPLAEYARLAHRHRYAALVTAEHLDLDPGDNSYGFYDPDRHLAAVAGARALAPETFVGLGVELSYQRERKDEIAAARDRLPYDMTIGSVHYLDDIGATITSREKARLYFEKTPVEEAYGSYFEILLQTAGSGLFDVLGHADICKRYGVLYYGPFEARCWEAELRAVFRACADTGTGLELNVAGWGQAPGEPYPGPEALALARQEGVRRVTVGSDAHDLARFGPAQIRRGLELLRETGFERVCYWREREPVELSIADLLAR
jgi:histidinol-phosphatase (PHP family)